MIDHFGIGVRDFQSALRFYERVISTLGIDQIYLIPLKETGGERVAGLGNGSVCCFWINQSDEAAPPLHFAFKANTRQQVDQFYTAAINAGGTDNGKPGLRPAYHSNYDVAFTHDLDGNNIEAVCHT